jgi:hypothetical protein
VSFRIKEPVRYPIEILGTGAAGGGIMVYLLMYIFSVIKRKLLS